MTQNVHRDARSYAFTVQLVAPNAETAQEHWVYTDGAGFGNVVADEEVVTKIFNGTACNLNIESFEFAYFAEESDWQGPMVTEFTGEVYAENSCTAVSFEV